MGLTGRPFLMHEKTFDQLNSIQVFLNKNTVYDDKVILDSHVGFYKGVLSVEPYNNKGKKLLEFFEKINYTPKAVIFVDDELHYVEDVRQTMKERNISFIGFRYGAADDTVFSFDPARAADELDLIFKGTDDEEFVKRLM